MISSDKSLGEITASLVRTVSPKVLPRRMAAIAVQIMRMLANGRPVSPEQVGEVCSLQQEETVEIVRQFQTMGWLNWMKKERLLAWSCPFDRLPTVSTSMVGSFSLGVLSTHFSYRPRSEEHTSEL